MLVKDIIAEDFANYKLPSMFIVSSICDFKCCKEANVDVSMCQNSPLVKQKIKQIQDEDIFAMFSSNPITKAVVIGGLEPIMQIDEILHLISAFRNNNDNHDFVIYTGYYPNEIKDQITQLSYYDNIIVKFGRYIPNRPSCFDNVLGVTLASDNQFALRIS